MEKEINGAVQKYISASFRVEAETNKSLKEFCVKDYGQKQQISLLKDSILVEFFLQ